MLEELDGEVEGLGVFAEGGDGGGAVEGEEGGFGGDGVVEECDVAVGLGRSWGCFCRGLGVRVTAIFRAISGRCGRGKSGEAIGKVGWACNNVLRLHLGRQGLSL